MTNTFGGLVTGAGFRWPGYPTTRMTKTTATTFTDPSGRAWAGHGPAAVVVELADRPHPIFGSGYTADEANEAAWLFARIHD